MKVKSEAYCYQAIVASFITRRGHPVLSKDLRHWLKFNQSHKTYLKREFPRKIKRQSKYF